MLWLLCFHKYLYQYTYQSSCDIYYDFLIYKRIDDIPIKILKGQETKAIRKILFTLQKQHTINTTWNPKLNYLITFWVQNHTQAPIYIYIYIIILYNVLYYSEKVKVILSRATGTLWEQISKQMYNAK